MTQESDCLTRLLPAAELYDLYDRIGNSINTQIDLVNANYDYLSKNNSFELLRCLGFVEARDDGLYAKNASESDLEGFKTTLLSRITESFPEVIDAIHSLEEKYDEESGRFYGFRNQLSLEYSGILMLLNDLGYVEIREPRVYILRKQKNEDKSTVRSNRRRGKISLEELEGQLLFKKKLGEEAEMAALIFEQELLNKQQINKTPLQISHIDSSAGYDIASYLDDDAKVPNKYIEVKNCPADYSFYMSKNEIETARNKGEKYYLYLYCRETKKIRIIQNPYAKIIENDEWLKDPQIFRIKQL